MRKLLTLTYAGAAYALALATFAYLAGWLTNLYVPRSIDLGPSTTNAYVALGIDVLLLAVFALQHSGMARPAFKRAWTRIVPREIERSTYVLVSCIATALFFLFWRPIPVVLWSLEGSGAAFVWTLHALGWAVLFSSTFLIDHFDLFGLSQAVRAALGRTDAKPELRARLFYRIVRHPIYVGWITLMWTTPHMTVGHLLFAAGMTTYILGAIPLEERDLVASLGPDYAAYRERVPMLLPGPPKSSVVSRQRA